MSDLELVDSESLPKCPHCEKEMKTLEKITRGELQVHVIYMCPHCKKIISIGYNFH